MTSFKEQLGNETLSLLQHTYVHLLTLFFANQYT